MMRPISVKVLSTTPDKPVLTLRRSTTAAVLNWTDGTPVSLTDPTTWGNPKNEIGYRIQRAPITNGTVGTYAQVGTALANVTTWADATAGTGQYAYTVTAYNASTTTAVSDAVIAQPLVTGVTPAASATAVPTTTTVTATFSEPVTGVGSTTFTLAQGTTSVAATVTLDTTGKVATLTPTATLAAGTAYTATLTTGITSVATGGSLTAQNWSFTIASAQGTGVTVISTTPSSGATGVAQNVKPAVTFSGDVTGVDKNSFTLKRGTTSVPAAVIYSTTTRTATLTPNSALAGDATYTLSLTTAIKSASGISLSIPSWTFLTGPVPTVTSINPANGATGVGLGTTTARTQLTASFSEAVTGLPTTAASTPNFTLMLGTATVASKVQYNGQTRIATLIPDAPLVADRTYTLSLSAAIKDVAGNPIVGKTWTFITGPAPTVTARTPAVNATGVSRTANITATFSEAVTGLPTTAAASVNFTIKRTSSGAAFTSVASYNGTTRVATLNPSGTLLANTQYTVTLASGIKDTAGNLLAPVSWKFTTGR